MTVREMATALKSANEQMKVDFVIVKAEGKHARPYYDNDVFYFFDTMRDEPSYEEKAGEWADFDVESMTIESKPHWGWNDARCVTVITQ